MKYLEQVTIFSKNGLSTLWNALHQEFPEEKIIFQQTKEDENQVILSRKNISEICCPFALWIHENICVPELKSQLSQYEILTEEERAEIFISCLMKLRAEAYDMIRIIQENLMLFLSGTPKLNLDGFLTFGMQEYREELAMMIEECIDEYMAKEDYLEFLEILRYFIEEEECRFGQLTIHILPTGKCHIYDEFDHEITKECRKKFMDEFQDENPVLEDFIISILILYLPQSISIYGTKYVANQSFLSTLESIFGNRLHLFSDRKKTSEQSRNRKGLTT